MPIICTDKGKLFSDNPVGMLMAGRPARLAGIVHRSDKYISSGFFVFSPQPNAGVGVVGDKMKLTK